MKQAIILIFCFSLFACSSPATQIPTQAAAAPSDLDPEMEAAFQEARNTLDSFIERIETPHPDRTLVAVKVRFVPPDGIRQDMWVDEISYQEGPFRGTMGDDIPSLRLAVGDKITIAREDILDWMIVEDGKLIGGYTIRLAFQRMSPEQRERFLETVNYAIED